MAKDPKGLSDSQSLLVIESVAAASWLACGALVWLFFGTSLMFIAGLAVVAICCPIAIAWWLVERKGRRP